MWRVCGCGAMGCGVRPAAPFVWVANIGASVTRRSIFGIRTQRWRCNQASGSPWPRWANTVVCGVCPRWLKKRAGVVGGSGVSRGGWEPTESAACPVARGFRGGCGDIAATGGALGLQQGASFVVPRVSRRIAVGNGVVHPGVRSLCVPLGVWAKGRPLCPDTQAARCT